ncbi:winged helix-turn-helix domain-containing protein [Endozoicomonas arenosclerae]|uniref:winged helix-turn-helix domain-containing protein n=1 Tax=Endozoicomonas arenosclerae TaxID=1633495 RepID=UPI000782D26A|nr:winged helix-turn-helix domain-containing protein [Endozoicomonas arenosclerae]
MDWKQGFRLGEWTVHPETGIFINGGIKRHAEPKLVDVLQVLANHQGNVVSRDELLAEVWQDLVVSDEVLTRCISELRTLLGDTSRERRYIRTVPRRGYMLVADVEALGHDVQSTADSEKDPLPELEADSAAEKIPDHPPSTATSPNRDAPWPVRLIMDFFGLLQSMISALVKVFKYSFVTLMLIIFMVLVYAGLIRDPDRPFAKVQIEMDEAVEVGGDSSNEEALLEVVDLAVDVGQQVQQELGRKIAIQKGVLKPGEEEFEGTSSYEAYEQYLLGRNFWRVRTESSLNKAVNYFNRAIVLDESYAQAWAGLADTLVLKTFYGFGERAELLAEADRSSAQAVKLAPELAEAHAARGVFLSESDRLDEAISSLKMAVRLKPDFSMAHMWLGNAYLGQGMARKAYESYSSAYNLDPLHTSVRLNYLSGLTLVGKAQEARLLAEKFALDSDEFMQLPIKQAVAAGYYDRALDRISMLQEQGKNLSGLEHKAMHSLIYLNQIDVVKDLVRNSEKRSDLWQDFVLRTLLDLRERNAASLKMTLASIQREQIDKNWCKGYTYDLLASHEHWLNKDWLKVERSFAAVVQNTPIQCLKDPQPVITGYLYQARAMEKLGDYATRTQHLNSARKAIESNWAKGWRSPEFMVAALAWALIEGQDDEARQYLEFMRENGIQPWGMIAMMPLLDDYHDAEVLKPYKGRLQLHYLQQQERAANLSSQLMKALLSADRSSTDDTVLILNRFV